MIDPHGIEMVDISNNFFDMVSGVSNMMYFKSQQIVLNRRNEEREVNSVLHHTYGIALDADLGREGVGEEDMWLQKNVLQGVVEGFCAAAADGRFVGIIVVASRRIALVEEDWH
jgi:hypothetical protein